MTPSVAAHALQTIVERVAGARLIHRPHGDTVSIVGHELYAAIHPDHGWQWVSADHTTRQHFPFGPGDKGSIERSARALVQHLVLEHVPVPIPRDTVRLQVMGVTPLIGAAPARRFADADGMRVSVYDALDRSMLRVSRASNGAEVDAVFGSDGEFVVWEWRTLQYLYRCPIAEWDLHTG